MLKFLKTSFFNTAFKIMNFQKFSQEAHINKIKSDLHKPGKTGQQLRNQIYYRCKRMGTLQVEVILTRWLDENMDKMSDAELKKFDQDVIQLQNPVLNSYLFRHQQIPQEHQSDYLLKIVDYVKSKEIKL